MHAKLLLAAVLAVALAAHNSAAAAAAPQAAAENIATFSVVAYDPRTGEVGVAVQSRFFAVGSVVPWAKAGVGAVATQAFGNTTFGPRILAGIEGNDQTARLGVNSSLLTVLGEDELQGQRQVGVVGKAGGFDIVDGLWPELDGQLAGDGQIDDWIALSFTGKECLSWAGGRTGVSPEGIYFAVQGNILTGPEVVDAMHDAMMQRGYIWDMQGLADTQTKAADVDDLAGRMLGALLAGQHAGGDSRGMQSAALLICQEGAGYGGYNDRKYDLRVDDATDPFEELARLLNLARPIAVTNQAYQVLGSGRYDEAAAMFRTLVDLEPDSAYHRYNLACALSRLGEVEQAAAHLWVAFEFDAMLKQQSETDPDLQNLREAGWLKRLLEDGWRPDDDTGSATEDNIMPTEWPVEPEEGQGGGAQGATND